MFVWEVVVLVPVTEVTVVVTEVTEVVVPVTEVVTVVLVTVAVTLVAVEVKVPVVVVVVMQQGSAQTSLQPGTPDTPVVASLDKDDKCQNPDPSKWRLTINAFI